MFSVFLWIFSTDTSVVFWDQVGLVRLGIFRLKLGENILFGIGNGAEFRPQNRVIKSPGHAILKQEHYDGRVGGSLTKST